jgi:hypothetical protein
MRALLVASAISFALPSTSYAVDAGESCTLRTKIKATPGPGRGKARFLARGSELQVFDKGPRYVRVVSQQGKLFIKRKAFEKFCEADVGADMPTSSLKSEDYDPRKFSPVPEPEPGPAFAEASEPASPSFAGRSDSSSEEAFGETIKIKVAVMDLRSEGISEQLGKTLTQTVAEALDVLGPFKTISTQDIVRMLELEVTKQQLGCDDVSCLAELGGALGADLMVSGSITGTGDESFMIQLQLTNIREAKVVARSSRRHEGNANDLFSEMRNAAAVLVRDVLGEKSGNLVLNVSEEGSTIMVDGAIVGVSPMETLMLPGGVHTISIRRSGFITFKQDVRINQGQDTKVMATLVPSKEFIDAYEKEAGFDRIIGWSTLGAGVLGLAVAGGAYVRGSQRADQLNARIVAFNQNSLRTTAEADAIALREAEVARWDTTAVIAGGVGIAAAVVGTIILMTGDDPDRYEDQGKHAEAASDDLEFFAVGFPGSGSLGIRF